VRPFVGKFERESRIRKDEEVVSVQILELLPDFQDKDEGTQSKIGTKVRFNIQEKDN
jgi:hypothetical protein